MRDRGSSRASGEARRTVPTLAAKPSEEFRQDLMVRYLMAVASHSAQVAAGERALTGHAGGGAGRPVETRPKAIADLQVSDIMRRSVPVPTVTADTGLLDVARLLARRKVGAVPVVDDGLRIVGVVAESDLLARAATLATPEEEPGFFAKLLGRRRGAQAGTAGILMTAPALTVHPWTTVLEAARAAAGSRIRQVFVTDHGGHLVGVVSRNELLHALVRDDTSIREEITSRVLAELGIDPAQVTVRVRNGTVTLTGSLRAALIPALTAAVERIADVNEVEDLLTEI